MRTLVEYRFVVSMAGSALLGVVGLTLWPFPASNLFLALIANQRPAVHAAFTYTYATLWFTTPFFVLNVGFSLLYIFVARWDRPETAQSLPPYPPPHTREGSVRGPRRAAPRDDARSRAAAALAGHSRTWAVHGHGHRRRRRHRQDLGLHVSLRRSTPRRTDATIPTRKVGGLVLEVKGDFCGQVQSILERHGRGDDYVEVSLTRRTATTRCTTISTPTRWPTASPR